MQTNRKRFKKYNLLIIVIHDNSNECKRWAKLSLWPIRMTAPVSGLQMKDVLRI